MTPTARRRWIVVAAIVGGVATAAALAVPWAMRTGAAHRMASEIRHRALGQGPPPTRASVPIPITSARLEEGRRLIRDTIARTAVENSFALLVDKSAYTLYAYRDGHRVGAWPVELGPDPVGAKEREGDLRTPEGLYRITWRRDVGQTRFYRALLIDYPNPADRARGRTGGHIEVHGMGSGKRPGEGGSNWTLGCMAMSNSDIDELFALGEGTARVAEHTPVAIVYGGTLADERYEVVGTTGR